MTKRGKLKAEEDAHRIILEYIEQRNNSKTREKVHTEILLAVSGCPSLNFVSTKSRTCGAIRLNGRNDAPVIKINQIRNVKRINKY